MGRLMAAGVRTLLVKFAGDSKGLNRAADQATSKLDKGRSAWGKLGKAAALGAVAVAAGVAAWGVSTANALMEIERLSAQTDAAIESMNVAWTNTAEIEAYADKIEKLSGVEAELVQGGSNVLLTFGNVQNAAGKGNAIFDRATMAFTDMSVALGTDMQGAATQVGKALNDPIKGVSALQRVGVSFTESQKDQIKALVESGDTLGAQKIILGELEKQFGGSAKAFGETMPGQIAKLKNAFGELSENLLARLMPVLDKVLTWFRDHGLPALKQFGGWLKTNLLPPLQAVGRFIGDTVVPAIAALVGWINKNREVIPAVGIAIAALLVPAFIAWAISAGAAAIATIAAAAPIILIGILIAALAFLVIKNWDTIKKVTVAVFNFVWGYLQFVWNAIVAAAKFVWEGIKRYFGFWKGILDMVIGWVTGAKDRVVAGFNAVVDFVKKLPGRIGDALSGLGNAISAPFRAGFGAAKDFYNNTIGGKGFDIPSWVPGVGGKSFRFPRFHQGGVVPGPLGREVPILARAGERVLTREQDQAAGGGQFTGTLVLSTGEFLGVVDGRISRSNRGLRRASMAGAGAAR